MGIRHTTTHSYIYKCGHITTFQQSVDPWKPRGPDFTRMPSVCRACRILQERDDYVRELQVRAAFDQESG